MLLTDKVSQFATDSNTVHAWVNGPASGVGSSVSTSAGLVRTPAKLIADNQANFDQITAQVDRVKTVDLAASSGASLVGFQQEGTEAVPTTVQSKLRELVSVGDYGDTDGIGTITINVPSQFATIQDAFNWLANKTIASGTTVTIQVADGTYTLTSGINANHPQGSQIRLVGNETTPDNCIITVSAAPTFDALIVSNGNTLGYLNGFRFTLASKAGRANNNAAVLANNGATIICGPKVKTNNWYYGIAARNGSFVSCDYAVVDNAGDVGIWAFVGSTVYCRYASSSNANDNANGYGYGFQAEYGSAMDCSNASASGCSIAGIASLSNSNLRAISATSSSNTGSGFLARDNGTIENHSSTANSNTRYGEERITGGVIHGSGVTLSTNTLGATSGFAYFDNSASLGGRIAVNGTGRIDNNGAAGWFFNTSGGPQLEVSHTASTSSWPLLTGSSTDAPRIVAQGGAANLDFAVQAKGTGSVYLGTHRANYVRINPAATGAPPSIYPEGEANLDLILGSKGTGVVRFGTWTANADVAVNGYITIKDAAGNTRKLATIA